MSSKARAQFLGDIAAFREALAEPSVRGSSPSAAYLRKGLAVNLFNSFEGFVSERGSELAAHANSGIATYSVMNERLGRALLARSLEVASAKYSKVREAERNDFFADLGRAFSSPNGALSISSLAWGWKGSNLSAEYLQEILKYMNVNSPFDQMRNCAGRLGFQINGADGKLIDFRLLFKGFAEERHKAAHVSTHPVSHISLGSAAENVVKFAITFDWLASVSADLVKVLHADFVSTESWLESKHLVLLTVQERKKSFAVMAEGGKNAKRVCLTSIDAKAFAMSSSSSFTLVVERDLNRNIVDWSIPRVS